MGLSYAAKKRYAIEHLKEAKAAFEEAAFLLSKLRGYENRMAYFDSRDMLERLGTIIPKLETVPGYHHKKKSRQSALGV